MKDLLLKKYKGIVKIGEDSPSINKISSGIFVFDLLTQGGIPINKFTTLWGKRSSGKTTFSFAVMNSFLKKYPEDYVVFVDFEHALNREWMGKFVKDLKRVIVVYPDYGEQGVDLAYELSQQSAVSLIVIDSLSSIISISEVEGDSEDSQVAVSSRLIRKLLNKLLVSMSNAQREGRPLTCLLLNQARANVGARKFESKVRMPGGFVVEHLSYLIVHMYLIKYESKNDIVSKAVHNFTIEKNKMGLPQISGEFKIDLQQGKINNEDIVVQYARELEIIKSLKNGFEYEGEKIKTLREIKERMANDDAFREELESKIIKKWWEVKE